MIFKIQYSILDFVMQKCPFWTSVLWKHRSKKQKEL